MATGSTDEDERRRALARATELVGDRWTLRVVDALLAGPARFSDLQERVTGVSPNVLSARLRHLEDHGLAVATPYQQRPVRHDYRLTDGGRALAPLLDLLAGWGDEAAATRVHRRCGTPVTAVLWCPTCTEPVDVHADDELIHV